MAILRLSAGPEPPYTAAVAKSLCRGQVSVLLLATLCALSGCAGEPGGTTPPPSYRPPAVPAFSTPIYPPEPPVPTTACLPASPVELDYGPEVLACALTPSRWMVTNRSETVLRFYYVAGSDNEWTFWRRGVTQQTDETIGAITTRELIARVNLGGGILVSPNEVIEIHWVSDIGPLRYDFQPAYSLAATITARATDARIGGSSLLDDANACFKGTVHQLRTLDGNIHPPTTQTWNTLVDDALNIKDCWDLLPDEHRTDVTAEIKSKVKKAVVWISENWHKPLKIVLHKP